MVSAAMATALLAACTTGSLRSDAPPLSVSSTAADSPAAQLQWLDRVTWGANASSQAELAKTGLARWMGRQLKPQPEPLPPAAQAQIDAMTISRTPLDQLVIGLDAQRKAADALPDEEQKKAARQAYQQALTRLAREAQQRFVLRALYSPNQLQEQMTWFWMNHFNVNLRKDNIRALVGDYEENAIRPHALGRFRDLLGATLHHPAMLRYLDNAQNAANRINENYARELMELHTLGVGGGYSQADVQELARVLTGVGVSQQPLDAVPNIRPAVRADYVRKGLFEFNPNRHDYGARRRCWASRYRRAASPKPTRRSIAWRAHPPPRASSRASSRCTSSPTSRRPRWSTAWLLGLHAQRWRHRRHAEGAVRIARIRRFARPQVPRPGALRDGRRAARLRRPRGARREPDAQLDQPHGRAAVWARDARRLSAQRGRMGERGADEHALRDRAGHRSERGGAVPRRRQGAAGEARVSAAGRIERGAREAGQPERRHARGARAGEDVRRNGTPSCSRRPS
jgi:hypothetical protein